MYALHANEINVENNSLIFYQGSHGDKLVDKANVVIPSCVFMKLILWELIFMEIINYLITLLWSYRDFIE